MRVRLALILLWLVPLLGLGPLAAQTRRKHPETDGPRAKRHAKAREAERTKSKPHKSKKETDGKRKSAKSQATERTPRRTTKAGQKRAAKAAEKPGAKRAAGTPSKPKPKTAAAPPAVAPKLTAPKKPATAKPSLSGGPVAPSPGTPSPKPVSPAAPPVQAAGRAPSPASPASLKEADAAYFRKSYAVALKGYRAAVAAKQVPAPQRAAVDYRIARCLGFTEQWDSALVESQRVAARYPGGIWEARSRSWLTQLYLKVPHQGWKSGDRYFRGRNAPEVDGPTPERVDLTADDQRKALANGDQAKALYEKVREAEKSGVEEANFAADLAQLVTELQLPTWAEAKSWAEPKDPAWKLDPAAPYSAAWPPPQKAQQLLLSAEQTGDANQKGLARLAQSLWLRGYHALMAREAWKESADGKRQKLPYPYQDRSALAVLRSLWRDYPQHPECAHARYMAGTWVSGEERFTEALTLWNDLIKVQPESPWSAEAKKAIAATVRVGVAVEQAASQRPGAKAKLTVSARNVETLKFTASRVKLEEMIKDARVLGRTRSGVTEIFARLGKIKGVRKFYQGEPVTWEIPLKPEKPYAAIAKEITTPLTEKGAYVVEVEGGPVRVATLVVISDLAVMQVVEGDRAHAFVVDAVTGRPVPDASVVIRELYSAPDPAKPQSSKESISAATFVTDDQGLAVKPLAPKRTSSPDIVCFAWKDGAYALSGNATRWRGEQSGDAAVQRTAYVYTERPTYRPGQLVHFRALLAEKPKDGDWRPVADAKATVVVQDSKQGQVAKQQLTTSEFGSIYGDVQLGSEPPLGDYGITVSWGGEKDSGSGGGGFRVEEYKKPEFKVSVTPGKELARFGDPVAAKVSAAYYFGGPVANAKVNYTVTASRWSTPYPFRRWGVDAEGFRFGRPQQIAKGTLSTDAKGEATITFTHKPDDVEHTTSLSYSINVEVTDASRRTIVGSGSVRASRASFEPFVSVRQGFYSPGETLQADLRTLNPQGVPVPAQGRLRVLRLTWNAAKNEFSEAEAYSVTANTDAKGEALLAWRADRAGRYRIEWQGRDDKEIAVNASDTAWVAGDEAADGLAGSEPLALVPRRPDWQPGQSAEVLAVCRYADPAFLQLLESGDAIVDKRLTALRGRSGVLTFPVTSSHVPDITLAVCGVREQQVLIGQVTLYVPEPDRGVNVTVTGTKAEYLPGEKATLTIHARDPQGRPVRMDAGIGVADSSVFYFGGDSSGDLAAPFAAQQHGANVDLPQPRTLDEWDVAVEDTQPVVAWEPKRWSIPDGLGSRSDDERTQANLWGGDIGGDIDGQTFPGQAARRAPDAFYVRHSRNAASPAMEVAAPAKPEPKSAAPPPAEGGKAKAPADSPAPRSNFADTALWLPSVVTDEKGEATVTVTWPDNLTTWRATVRGWTQDIRVGEGTADFVTSKELLVRLAAPRFFVERDEVVLSANVHNYTKEEQRVRVALQLDGETLFPAGAGPLGPAQPRPLRIPRSDEVPPTPGSADRNARPPDSADAADLTQWVGIAPGEEKRLDWRVRVEKAGDAKVRVLADAGGGAMLSDGVEMSFPVLVHGVEKLVVKSGSMLMAPDAKPGTRAAKLNVELPAERAPESGELIVQVSPSVAATMLDALPYLIDYPYGCVEQTMSRFLPAVVSAKTLTDLGLDLGDLRKRAEAEYARIKAQSPTDRPELSGYTYPEGSPGLRDVARMAREQWRWRAEKSPVYRPEVLKQITAQGLARLQRFQSADGGWGWWQGESGDPHMTAYVLQGLVTARAAGVEVPATMIAKAFAFLEKRFADEKNAHDLTYEGWVLTYDPKRAPAAAAALLTKVYPTREKLSPYGLALLALALDRGGHNAEAKICLENMENTSKPDTANGTVSWTRDSGNAWDWQNNDVEGTATALRAYLRLNPGHRFVPMIVRWLAGQRSGDAWSSTRETSTAIQALAEYIRVNKELAPDYKVNVEVAGQFKRTFTVNAENALLFDNRLVVPAAALGSGTQTVTVTREGKGNLYYSAYLRYFSLEEGIRATGNEIRVRRRYFRLVRPEAPPAKDTPVTADGLVRTELRPGQPLNSGDVIEVELLLESKNQYDYLVFEDMKPSGCEPVDLRSGTRYGNGLVSNMELRDEKVAFFITRLPTGKRLITYRLRAEIPGDFHALPVNGYAMYSPEVRCISDEGFVAIKDAAP